MPARNAARTVLATAVLATAVGLSACAPYVNIPAQAGDVARDDIDDAPVRKITVPALRGVIADNPPAGLYVVQLTAASEGITYPAILPRIGDNARAPFDPQVTDDTPVFEVVGVRVRGFAGEVDIVRPGPYGGRQLVTVYLKDPPFGGWDVERLRVWRGPADQSVPVRVD